MKLICNKLFVLILIESLNLHILYAGFNESSQSKQDIKYQTYYEELLNKASNTINSDSIVLYGQKALYYAKEKNIFPSKALMIIGSGYYQTGDFSSSLEYYLKAASEYKNANEYTGLAVAYINISNIYSIQKNYNNADYFLKSAIETLKVQKDSFNLGHALHNLAFNYYVQNVYDSALIYYNYAYDIFKALNRKKISAYCIGNSGLVYVKQGNIIEAERSLKQAIDSLRSHNDEYAITDFVLEYSKILQRKGQIDSAIDFGLDCYNISIENNISERIRDASKCLANFYSEKGMLDSAYFYHVIFANYSDSLKNIETVQKMADLRTTYEVSQKQAEVDLLEKRKTLNYIIIASLSLAIILGALVIFLYYRNLKRIKSFSDTLKIQSNELKESNAIKDKFFSIISHDLRSPISSLAAISLMIEESLEQDNKSILHEASDYIDKTVYSLSGLLENLLNWALSQQGQFPFTPDRINTKELISEEVRLLTTIAISKEIKLLLDLHESLYIIADQNSFKTIIRNLLSNAYKFTAKGGEVVVRSDFNGNNQAFIEISDNGIGMTLDKLQNIFKLKGDKSTRGTEHEKGLGLGLTLVHEFVQKNNGQIAVQSEVGKGTTFTLSFPIPKETDNTNEQ